MTKRSITIKRKSGQPSKDDFTVHLQTIADLNKKIAHLERCVDCLRKQNHELIRDYNQIDQILAEKGLVITRALHGDVYIRKGMDFDPDDLIFPPYNDCISKEKKERDKFPVMPPLLTVLILAFVLFLATTIFHNVP